MPSSRFTRYVLRTTDVAAATTFYDAVLDGRGDAVVPLHESALARGARPHWLGQVHVGGVGGAEAVAARFIESGATRLGPPPGVADFVILRDPGGAIVAVTESSGETSAGVVWHQLNTGDPDRAAADYASLFGWSFSGEELDLGRLGRHRRFAPGPGGSFIGMISDIARRPEVHPHWLYFFAAASLDTAVDRVRALNGSVIGPIELPSQVRVAVCEDPQGAAFGLMEPEDAARLATD